MKLGVFCCNLKQKTLQSPAARAAVTSLGVNIVTSSLMPCMDYITRAIRQCGTSCCSAALDFEVIMRDGGGETCVKEIFQTRRKEKGTFMMHLDNIST